MKIKHVKIDRINRLSCDLPVSDLPDGLIAVVGANGSGKTTLLECMVPVPLRLAMASRSGALTGYADETRRDNVIRVTMDHAGHEWTSVIEVDPGTGRSGACASAYLQRDGITLPTTDKGNQREYLDAVAEHLPPASVVMASAFSTQGGAGDLLSMPPRERRDLFAALLRCGEDQAIAAAAKEGATHARAALQAAERACARHAPVDVESLQASAEDARVRVDTLRTALRDLEAERDRLEAANSGAAAAASDLSDARRQAAAAAARVDSLRQRYSAADLAHRGAEAARELAASMRDSTPDAAAIEAWRVERREHEAAAAEARGKIAGLPALPAGVTSDGIDASLAAALAAWIGAGHAGDANGDEVCAALATRADECAAHAERARAEAARRRADLDAAPVPHVESAAATVERLERSASLIARVPCGGGTVQAGAALVDCGACELLTDATRARDGIPAARAALDAARASKTARDDLAAAWATADSEARIVEGDAREAATEASVARRRWSALVETRRAADAAAERAAAERVEHAATAESARLAVQIREGEHARARLEAAERDAARLPELADARAALATDGHAARTDLDAATQRIAALEATAAGGVGEQIGRAREAIAKGRATLDGAITDAARAQGRVEAAQAAAVAQGEAQAARDALAERVAALSTVAEAFGPAGVQAMAIDRAAPDIAGTANQLLARVFDGRFAVEIITQRERARGPGMVPTLDVVVHDGKTGRAVPPSDLSGGERVIVSEAIKLAIAVRHKVADGSGLRDLYRDECDSALDPEAALAYPPLLRAAMAVGGFERCYFITHRPDLAAQADGWIDVSGGTAVIGD